MSSTVEEIAREAKHLSREEKALLLAKISSMIDDETSEDLKTEWLNLAKDRFSDVKTNEVETIPAEDVMRDAKAHLE